MFRVGDRVTYNGYKAILVDQPEGYGYDDYGDVLRYARVVYHDGSDLIISGYINVNNLGNR